MKTSRPFMSAHRLPPAAPSKLLQVKPGDRLLDGFGWAYKFLAERQPVTNPFVFLEPGLTAGAALSSVTLSPPTHPFSCGIRMQDNAIVAQVDVGKINGKTVAIRKWQSDLAKNKIGAFIVDNEFDGGAFKAVGQGSLGMPMGVILKIRATQSISTPGVTSQLALEGKFEIKNMPFPTPGDDEAYILLTAIDKDQRLIPVVRSNLRVDAIKRGNKWHFWSCQL